MVGTAEGIGAGVEVGAGVSVGDRGEAVLGVSTTVAVLGVQAPRIAAEAAMPVSLRNPRRETRAWDDMC
jgi:hypothetical protein